MGTARKTIIYVCNYLCYIFNNRNITQKLLKSLLLDSYTNEEIIEAKDILFKELDELKFANILKVARRRRDSTGSKPALDIDNLLTLLVFCDENGYSSQLPLFAASSPDRMPSSHITAGDLELI